MSKLELVVHGIAITHKNMKFETIFHRIWHWLSHSRSRSKPSVLRFELDKPATFSSLKQFANKHRLLFDQRAGFSLTHAQAEWCQDHLSGPVEVKIMLGANAFITGAIKGVEIRFANDMDLLAFKLRWL